MSLWRCDQDAPELLKSKGSREKTRTRVKRFAVVCERSKTITSVRNVPERNERGRQYRQYFLDLEKAWNTPEQIFARALKMADQQIEKLKASNAGLLTDVQRMKPKEVFADAVSVSNTCILIGELAKILKQNGVDIGQSSRQYQQEIYTQVWKLKVNMLIGLKICQHMVLLKMRTT